MHVLIYGVNGRWPIRDLKKDLNSAWSEENSVFPPLSAAFWIFFEGDWKKGIVKLTDLQLQFPKKNVLAHRYKDIRGQNNNFYVIILSKYHLLNYLIYLPSVWHDIFNQQVQPNSTWTCLLWDIQDFHPWPLSRGVLIFFARWYHILFDIIFFLINCPDKA